MEEQIINEVKGTPFSLVQTEDGKYLAVLGRYALTKEKFDNEERFRKWLEENHWTATTIVASIVADQFNNTYAEQTKQPKEE